MGFYTTDLSAGAIRAKEEPVDDRGGVLKKRAVRSFVGVHCQDSLSRQTKSPASKAFHAVVLRTITPGVPLYGSRYYNTTLGRWPSRDPIGERGGRNVYGFARNSAIVYFDLFGLLLSYDDCGSYQFQVLGGGHGVYNSVPSGCSVSSLDIDFDYDQDLEGDGWWESCIVFEIRHDQEDKNMCTHKFRACRGINSGTRSAICEVFGWVEYECPDCDTEDGEYYFEKIWEDSEDVGYTKECVRDEVIRACNFDICRDISLIF